MSNEQPGGAVTQTTRAEHHADSPTYQVRQARRVVHRALEAGHVGRANATHGSELARFVPVAETTVRNVIAELREDPDGPPIGNCPAGYFVIDTQQEFDDYAESVKEEIATKRDRLKANAKAFNRRRHHE